MKAKVGLYFTAPRGKQWCVYCYSVVTETGSSANKVCSFLSKEEAASYVYRMNG